MTAANVYGDRLYGDVQWWLPSDDAVCPCCVEDCENAISRDDSMHIDKCRACIYLCQKLHALHAFLSLVGVLSSDKVCGYVISRIQYTHNLYEWPYPGIAPGG